MKSKTILFFPALYPYHTGGMEVFNTSLAKTLLKKPDVILLTTKKISVDSLNGKSQILQVNDNLFLLKRWGLGYFSILIYCLFSSKTRLSEWKTLMVSYTSNFNYNAWPILLFSKLFGFKYVVHCHGGGVKEWKTPILQNRFFRNAKKVAAVSFSIIDEYNRRTGLKFEYLPPLMPFNKSNSSDKFKEKFRITVSDRVILYVGSLKPLKSPETLITAFKRLNVNNVRLVIAGDGILRKNLEQRYACDNVIFLGMVPNESIGELYAVSDIYVIPSWFEGTPLSLLEAMSNGLCCIGSDVMGINDIIVDGVNGLLFPVNDVDKLTSLLQETLSNDKLRKKLSDNALKSFIDEYDYSDFLYKIESFLSI